MFLDTVHKKIQVKLVEATTTTECDCVASYVDIGTATFTPASTDRSTSGSSTVDLIAAPSIGLQRQIKEVIVYNRDTVEHTVKLILNNNGTSRYVFSETIAAGEAAYYRPDALRGAVGATGATGATGASAGSAGTPLNIQFSLAGQAGPSYNFLIYKVLSAFDLPATLSGSYVQVDSVAAGNLPTADTPLTIYQNGVSIGTITFAATTGVPTIVFSSLVSFAPGDVLQVQGDPVADVTAGDFAFALLAHYS